MKIQSKIITNFLEDLPGKCKNPLDEIITQMLESSKYIDDSTLIYDESNNYDKEHYHNWDCKPTKIHQIKDFENQEYNENNDIKLTTLLGNNSTSNIECIKGDIQLGKRVHACIIMWLSIYIYERPVLYLFRPLNIDKEQLRDDIDGTSPWNFNIEWVKSKFNNSIKYYDYQLPKLTDIKDKKVANKLTDKEYISSPKMIYAGLMNPTDLDTLNRKFYDYIINYMEKVNITLIIDESDLLSPTAENSNNISEKDTINSKSERLISRLVNKVAHTIHITGTAHSFFWNFTTALSDEEKTIIPVEKVFVMKRHNNYYGFMKKNINFSSYNKILPDIVEWWSKGKRINKEKKYHVIKDYDINIKKIINTIIKRENVYNSLLISEEKIQNNQIKLAEKIITDFSSLFCVVFHGKTGKSGLPTGLRIYFPKKIDKLVIETELQQVVINEKRLDKIGGIKGIPTSDINKEYYDNYKYYDIDMKSKEFNIKMIYKILAMLFKKINSNKTIITITGKYGERGYSFTSDYYNKDNEYVLHLTDQYFVSHASFNCTNIFQRARIQGKYTDNPQLTFWTTKELVEIINQYVDFILKIENTIMSLPRGHMYIRNLCEINLFHKDFMKTLGTLKERKNIKSISIKYDKNNNAMIYSFPPNLKLEEYENHFSKWCIEQGIEFDCFINRLEFQEKEEYIKIYYLFEIKCCDFDSFEKLCEFCKNNNLEIPNNNWMSDRVREKKKNTNNKWVDNIGFRSNDWKVYTLDEIKCKKNTLADNRKRRFYICYDDHVVRWVVKYITNNKILPVTDLNILEKQNYKEFDNKILYSTLNYKYINDNFLEHEFEDELNDNDTFDLDNDDINEINDNSYFFLTANGHVYHHDPEKSIKKANLKIKAETERNINSEEINNILIFYNECIKPTKGSNRVGIKRIMRSFNNWCKEKGIKEYIKLKHFVEDFEKTTGLSRSKSNTNGYKIELKVN